MARRDDAASTDGPKTAVAETQPANAPHTVANQGAGCRRRGTSTRTGTTSTMLAASETPQTIASAMKNPKLLGRCPWKAIMNTPSTTAEPNCAISNGRIVSCSHPGLMGSFIQTPHQVISVATDAPIDHSAGAMTRVKAALLRRRFAALTRAMRSRGVAIYRSVGAQLRAAPDRFRGLAFRRARLAGCRALSGRFFADTWALASFTSWRSA